MNGNKTSLFARFAKATALWAGRPGAVLIAAAAVIVWGLTGPIFDYSDTWQLVINTGTTIVTFLMVFLIQNTQNRDSIAVQIKLDELINAVKEARNELIDLESLSDEDLEEKRKEMLELAEKAQDVVEDLEEITGTASEEAA